ncbi:DUF2231 domain-containing protein [Micromonospora peucetia]|uniref:DUF2231 domain-containing protein n=1 Tax=Micromonospora peucetia TaxID=47871 RepID=A0A1C6W3P3_9ACTN|nr:DUF2231 domain-containing protein [Micromonospora peucetia]MCX4390421.1 DUF2231 domain-containing protein [Micromonospora peucetia]WSA32282.1 DUF2231 domain-containing protein [Micromonospora peucetia]SCL73141.1 Uncharacterized membrane protein [Micromonospora peucetia]
MQSRLRVQGHPIQPMLVTFPFGLFVSATVFDLTDVLGGPAFLGEVGYWTSVAALVAAAMAAVAGMIDLWDVPVDRTRRTAITFNLVNVAMAALFLIACLVRADAPQRGASVVLLLTELVALAIGAVGVSLGVRLVRRFDAGRRAEATTFDALTGVPDATIDLAPHRP